MDLYKYRNALGIPGQGIHSYRLFGVAIADVIMTIIGTFLFSLAFKTSFLYTLITLFVLGIVLHRLFFVRSTIDKALFPNQ
jgi:uncharacterized membrane protein